MVVGESVRTLMISPAKGPAQANQVFVPLTIFSTLGPAKRGCPLGGQEAEKMSHHHEIES